MNTALLWALQSWVPPFFTFGSFPKSGLNTPYSNRLVDRASDPYSRRRNREAAVCLIEKKVKMSRDRFRKPRKEHDASFGLRRRGSLMCVILMDFRFPCFQGSNLPRRQRGTVKGRISLREPQKTDGWMEWTTSLCAQIPSLEFPFLNNVPVTRAAAEDSGGADSKRPSRVFD